MSVAQAEGKFKVPKDTKPISNKSIVFNLIFSIIVICLIIQTLKVNILSNYSTVTDGEYFHCSWDAFDMRHMRQYTWDKSLLAWYTYNSTWANQSEQCESTYDHPDVNCDWFNNPLKSGKLWYYCNIIALVSLAISIIGYIFIAVTRKYPKLKEKYPSMQPQKIFFVTILFQSFIPTILLLIAIVYWFDTNGNHDGCWKRTYIDLYDDMYDTGTYSYNDRQIGESMILDIVAGVLVWIHLMVCINIGCSYLGFDNKKKRNSKRNRKIKGGEPMLFEDKYNGDIVDAEYEGYNGKQMEYDNHVRIESIAAMAPGNDAMDEGDIRIDDVAIEQNEYDSVKQWFFEAVAIPQNYKESYYNKLIENGFDNFVVIKYIDNQDLLDIGVNKLGHRKTILIATRKL